MIIFSSIGTQMFSNKSARSPTGKVFLRGSVKLTSMYFPLHWPSIHAVADHQRFRSVFVIMPGKQKKDYWMSLTPETAVQGSS